MWRTRYGRKPAHVASCGFYGRFSGDLKRLCNRASNPNSRVAERVAPQASLAPAQAPLAWGALSERLVPPFLQSVSLSCKVRVIGAPSATLSAKRFTLLYKDALPQRQSSVFTQRKLPEPHTLKNFHHGVRATRNPLNNPR